MEDEMFSKVIPATPLNNYIAAARSFAARFFLSPLVFILETLLKTPLFVSIPDKTLASLNSTTPSELSILQKLQSSGYIKKIFYTKKYSDEPKIFVCQTYNKGGGADFFSKKKALWRAVGESVERSVWVDSDTTYRGKTIFTDYDHVPGRKLNIEKLPGFSKMQIEKFKVLQFNRETKFEWIPAYSYTSKSRIWIPLQLVSGYYSRNNVPTREPMLRWSVSTGLATGRSLFEALCKGALEDIERDAFMLTYLNKISPPRLNLEDFAKHDNQFADLYKSFKRYRLELEVFVLPTDFSVYVICAAIIDRTGKGPAITLGAKADPDFREAFWGAVQECHFIRYGMKGRFKKEYSAQRMQLEDRQIYWAQLKHLHQLDFLFKGNKLTESEILKKTPLSTKDTSHIFEVLISECQAKKYSLIGFELENGVSNKLGFRTAQVLIPELQPLHLDESIPYFGGQRLQEIPKLLGYTPASTLNIIPHPFP